MPMMCTCVMYLRSALASSNVTIESSSSTRASAPAICGASPVDFASSASTCSYEARRDTERMMKAQHSYTTHAAHSTQICTHVSTTRSNMSNSTCVFSILLTTTNTVKSKQRLKKATISFMIYDMQI